MSEVLESNVVDAVANTNFKTIGEFPSLHFISIMEDSRLAAKQMNENLMRGSARLNGALDNLITRQLLDVAQPDPSEAASATKMWTGVDPMSQGLAYSNNMGFATSLNTLAQVLLKNSQTTPPVTVPPPAA